MSIIMQALGGTTTSAQPVRKTDPCPGSLHYNTLLDGSF